MRQAAWIAAFVMGFAGGPLLAAGATLSPADTASAFKAAGYKQDGKRWVACAQGTISEVRDINGDGLPDAVITEESTECHGMAGQGFSLVSKQADGSWKRLAGGTGIATFLASGNKGWPDLEVGGPGFCFPVLRWNGQKYVPNRYEYEGKRCKP